MIKLFLCISLFVIISFSNNAVVGQETSEIHSQDENKTEVYGERRIAGGRYLSDNEYLFPYQGGLKYLGTYSCGVSIIHPRWLLTAAHCLQPGREFEATVFVGSILLAGDYNVEVYEVSTFVRHPGFQFTQSADELLQSVSNDIGLIKTQRDIIFNERVQPVFIGQFFVQEYTYATIAGWGMSTNDLPGSDPNRLQFVDLLVISQQECSNYLTYVNDDHLCTGVDPGRGACAGDSGSALVANGVQIGVLSAGNCVGNHPNLYMKVSSYVPWIQTIMSLM